MAHEEEVDDQSLYSGSEFEFQPGEQLGDIEDEDASAPTKKGKLKSTVTFKHTGSSDAGASGSGSQAKGSARGALRIAVGEDREGRRSRSPLRRVSFDEAEGERAREKRIAEDVTRSLRAEMQEILERVRPREGASAVELDKLKLEQRTSSLMARGAMLSSEGARAQYLAFARIKASAEEVRRKIVAGDGIAATEALDKLERVVDLRLETIQRADTSPGGWAVATVFERMAFDADTNQPKLDRCWKAAAAQVDEKKDSRKAAARGRPAERGRGNYLFRSVMVVFMGQLLVGARVVVGAFC